MRWCHISLMVSFFCATATWAADKKEPTDGEPPLEYVLTVDGQNVAINAGQTVKVKVGDREVQIRLTPNPQRILKLPGLSLPYPANYTYELKQGDKAAPQWTLHGRHTLIIITRVRVAADAVVAGTVNNMTRKFKDAKQSEEQFSIGGSPLKVARIDFTLAAQKLRHYVFGLSSGDGNYLIILQETPNDDGSSDDETKELIDLLDKAVVTRP